MRYIVMVVTAVCVLFRGNFLCLYKRQIMVRFMAVIFNNDKALYVCFLKGESQGKNKQSDAKLQ